MVRNLWLLCKNGVFVKETDEQKIKDLEEAFYLGASSLFELMVGMLDSDREPTENDLKKMDKLNEELQEFNKNLEAKIKPKH